MQAALTLVAGLQATYSTATHSLMAIIREIDADECPKRAAMIGELGARSESHLSEALHESGKNFPLRWLPGYVRHDSRERIANEIARWCGGKVVPLKPRTPAEKLARLERVLDGMGMTGQFVREQADALPDSDQD